MYYIVFLSHSLHWRYIKIAFQEYVIMLFIAICKIQCKMTIAASEIVKQLKILVRYSFVYIRSYFAFSNNYVVIISRVTTSLPVTVATGLNKLAIWKVTDS